MRRYIYILISILLLCGCDNNKDMLARLDGVDSLMEYSPKQAYDSLQHMRRQWNEAVDEEVEMKWLLLDTKARNKLFMPLPSDSIFCKVVEYYDRCGSVEEKMMSHYLSGGIYRDYGDAPKAIDSYNYVIHKFEDYKNNKAYNIIALANSEKAELMYKQLLYSEAIDAYDEGIKYALKSNDSVLVANIYCYKSHPYVQLNEVDSAIKANEMSADMYLKLGKREEAAMVVGSNMWHYHKKGDYGKMKAAIDLYMSIPGMFRDGNIEKGREIFYYFMGEYCLNKQMVDSAKYYFYKELTFGQDLDNRYAATNGLMDLYIYTNNNDSAVKYSMLSARWNDSIIARKKTETIARNNSLYEYERYKNIAYKAKEEKHNAKVGYCIVIAFFVGFAAMCVVVYRKKIKTMLRKHALLQKEEKKQEQMLEVQKMINSELQAVNNDLESKHEKIVRENKLLISKLNEYSCKEKVFADRKSRLKLEADLTNSEIYKWMVYYSKNGQSATEGMTKKAKTLIEEKIPSFEMVVKSNCVLTEVDYMVCVLVRMHLRPSQICIVLQVSSAELSVKRKRLLKKIFGEDGSPKDFDDRILRIY